MRKLIFLLLVIFVLPTIGYSIFALSRDNSSTVVVKMFGPGATPSVCETRMRPHFDSMEGAMTDVAETLLASDDILSIGYSYDQAYFALNAVAGSREPTQTEIETFKPKFGRLGKVNYFSPNLFTKAGEIVLVDTVVECGVSPLDWVKLRLGIDYERVTKPVSILSRYVYWPSGVHDIDVCDDSLIESGAVDYCEFKLNDNWRWEAKWATFPLRGE